MFTLDKRRQNLISKKAMDTDSTVLEVTSKIFDLTREFEILTKRFEKEYPEYSEIKFNIKTISTIQLKSQIIMPSQSLMEYFVGDSSIFIFVIKKNDYQVVEVKKDFPLKDWVEQIRSGIEISGKKDTTDITILQAQEKYAIAASMLYQKIVAPVEALLTKNLIIIPDGELNYLPFEALLVEPPKQPNNFKTYQYLVGKH